MRDALTPKSPAASVPLEAEALLANPVIQVVLQAVGGFVMVLNASRQILAMNPELLRALGIHDSEPILGLRPGDALGCLHALSAEGGCHTTESCRSCGAFLALLQADRSGTAAVGECTLLRQRAHRIEPAAFRVRATPLTVGGQAIHVLVLQDISAAQARASLERLFYHDLQNTVQALQGWCELLEQPKADPERVGHHLVQLTERLGLEIASQRMLAHAEEGTLHVRTGQVDVQGLLGDLVTYFQGHAIAAGRTLEVEPPGVAVVQTDPALLLRILVNMVKNALEAIPAGERVRVRVVGEGDRVAFRVVNPGRLAPEVAQGLFRRTFSTKGTPGRGYGTYSMKLLGETYLGGHVGFLERPEVGEVEFYLTIKIGLMT